MMVNNCGLGGAHARAVSPRTRLRTLAGVVSVVGLVILSACAADRDAAAATRQELAAPDSANPGGAVDPTDGPWDSVLEAAQAEGRVLVYTSTGPETVEAAEAAFEAAHPDIDAEFVRISSSELLQRVDAEYDGGVGDGADVVLSSRRAYHLDKAGEEGFFAPLVGPNVAALDDGRLFADQQAVVTTANPAGFAWNTNAVSEPLEITDLADPRFEGRLGTMDLASENIIALMDYYGELFGEEFLRGIAANRPSIFPSAVPMTQSLAAGELDVTLVAYPATTGDDMPVELAFIDRPVAISQVGSATGRGNHPNAGQVFLDWLVSTEGQEAWAADGVSVVDGVDSAVFTLDEITLLDAEPMSQEEIDARRAALSEILGFQ